MRNPSGPRFAAMLGVAFCLALAAGRLCAEEPAAAAVSTPEEQLRLAEGLLSRNFTDMARLEIGKFLEKYPDHQLAPRAMLCLIESQRAAGQVDEALASSARFIQRWPQHELAPRLGLARAEILLKKGQVPAAEAAFKELGGAADATVAEAATYGLGQLLAQQGKAAEARAAFQKLAGQPLAKERPYRYYAAFALAATSQRQGEFPAAETGYRHLADDSGAPPGIREESLYRLAEMAFLRGDYAPAVATYEKQVLAYPEGRYAREGWKRRAWATFQLKDYAKSLAMAADWQKLYGEAADPEVQYLVGANLVGLGRHGEALPLFAALEKQPGLTPDFRRLSVYQQVYCLLRCGQAAAAEALGRSFLKDNPQAPEKADVLFFVGEACYGQGNLGDAILFYRQALDNFLGDWQYVAEASMHLSDCYERQGKAGEAAALYRGLAKRDAVKNKADMLLRAGDMERRAGNFDAAMADFERVRTEFTGARDECRMAVMNLAELHADRKNYDQAIVLVHDLLKRDPNQAQDKLLLFSGYLLFLQQKYAEAETVLRQAAALPKLEPRLEASIKYYLAATLLERRQDEEGLTLFAAVLALPDHQRPPLSDASLFRLQQLFFDHGQLEASEKTCTLLARSPIEATRHRARLRQAQSLQARGQVQDSRKVLDEVLLAVEGKSDAGSQFVRQEALSLAGEVCLLLRQNDRAVTAFQQCLATPSVTAESAARARYGLAQVLRQEGNAAQALQYAVKTFVLSDDPFYAPRAMAMAVELLAAQNRLGEAVTTWREMRQRFPVFAELQQKEPGIRAVSDAAASLGGK